VKALVLASLVAGCAPAALEAPTPAWVNDTSTHGGSNQPAPLVDR
jgi:hypothetical protein